jgi:hypothetical protein
LVIVIMRNIFAFAIFAAAVFALLLPANASPQSEGARPGQSAQPTDVSAHRRRVYRRAYRTPYYGWTPYWDRTPYDGGYYKLYPYRYWYPTIFPYGPWW